MQRKYRGRLRLRDVGGVAVPSREAIAVWVLNLLHLDWRPMWGRTTMKLLSRRFCVITIFVSIGALVGACHRGPDVKDRVSQQLKDERIEDVNVDYDRDTRIVHLKGTVDSAAEKQRAERVAERVVGTSGRVANELTVKHADEHTADDMDGAIRKQLNATVANDRALQDRDINFDVNNGIVTIKGHVRTTAEKQKVGEIARSAQNVKDVVNGLEIDRK
jgi:osmotically-inducible protein OsmY